MTPAQTERIKLLAGALDRVSTAFVTIGILTPAVAYLYNLADVRRLVSPVVIALGSASWLIAAVVLHLLARRILGRLR